MPVENLAAVELERAKFRSVQELYGRHRGETIYVVGSGASLRVFPTDFLADKITIGLNMAWKSAPVKYSITIHPELNIPEFIDGQESRPEITWISSINKSMKKLTSEQFAYARRYFYAFRRDGQVNSSRYLEPSNTGRILDWVRQPTEDYLYVWSSIAQTAANLAANMGAKYIVLVGCDNCSLFDNYYAHKQHTLWQGSHPEDRYREYYEGMAEVRTALNERGVGLMSLTPFLGLNAYEQDFVRLCKELDQEPLITSRDISPLVRPRWRRVFRGIIYQICERLGLVEEVRTVKRWLKTK